MKASQPFSSRQDCIGPIGKSPWDVAALLSQVTQNGIDYTKCTAERQPWMLGVVQGPFVHQTPETEAMFKTALETLGRSIELTPVILPDTNAIYANSGKEGWKDGKWIGPLRDLLLVTELCEALNDHLACLSNCSITNLKDLIAWNTAHPVCQHFLIKLII